MSSSMVNKLALALILNLLVATNTQAEALEKGTQELGISNIGIGYSSQSGFLISANTRYQYFVLNRFALGGAFFYNNFNDHEWMGLGPVASYIFFTTQSWFGRVDQQVTLAKFNGFNEKMAEVFGTSGVSINYLPPMTNFFIGGGYAHTYALNDGEVVRPNAFQVFAGWLWQ